MIRTSKYRCFQLEVPEPEITEREAREVGIDGGLHSLLALSDGTLVENPRWLRNALAELGRRQRRRARRKQGSRRRRKAAFPVAKQREPIANQRRDVWHKITRALADECSLIAIEDLTRSFMTHNHHMALSAHDAGLCSGNCWRAKWKRLAPRWLSCRPSTQRSGVPVAAGWCKKIRASERIFVRTVI